MAYREVAMWEILAVLERAHRGESRAAIARVTGHSRKTVRRYLATAWEVGWEPGRESPTEELAAEVYRRHRPARERGPGEVEVELLPYVEQLRSGLTPGAGERRGLKLTKVQRLLERQGIRIPYSSLHRFAVEHCDFGRKRRVTVRMAPCTAGEEAEVDFGRLGLVPDPEAGRSRMAWALVVVLVHSRHQYVHVTYSQRLRDVLDGLEDAWHFFGGVARRVVLDNLKPAVTKADRYDPTFQRTCEEYPRFWGSLWGTVHKGLSFVLSVPRETNDAILATGDIGVTALPGHPHYCHAFRGTEFRELLTEGGLRIDAISAATCLTTGWGSPRPQGSIEPFRREGLNATPPRV